MYGGWSRAAHAAGHAFITQPTNKIPKRAPGTIHPVIRPEKNTATGLPHPRCVYLLKAATQAEISEGFHEAV